VCPLFGIAIKTEHHLCFLILGLQRKYFVDGCEVQFGDRNQLKTSIDLNTQKWGGVL
jgi:hypothetical protein